MILLVILLVLQFLPYWHWVDEKGPQSLSIQGYVWIPYHGTDFDSDFEVKAAADSNTRFFRENIQDNSFWPDRIAVATALQLIFAVLGVILFMRFPETPLVSLFTVVASLCGLVNYLGDSIFSVSSLWMFHLTVQVIAFAVGLVALYFARRKAAASIRAKIEAANAA